MSTPHILIADDETEVVTQVSDAFVKHGYRTLCTHNGIEAWNELVSHPDIAACVVDLQMPPGTHGGKDLVVKIRRSFSKLLPIVVYSGRGTISSAHEVTKAGANAFVEKEAGTQQLIDVATKLMAEAPHTATLKRSSLNELARSADLPHLALMSFRDLEHLVRKRVLSLYTPTALHSLFSTKGQVPPQHVLDKLAALADFTDERKLALGDILDLLAALSARQLHKLPPLTVVTQLISQIVPIRNKLVHGREVTTRELVVAITASDDLIDKMGRE